MGTGDSNSDDNHAYPGEHDQDSAYWGEGCPLGGIGDDCGVNADAKQAGAQYKQIARIG